MTEATYSQVQPYDTVNINDDDDDDDDNVVVRGSTPFWQQTVTTKNTRGEYVEVPALVSGQWRNYFPGGLNAPDPQYAATANHIPTEMADFWLYRRAQFAGDRPSADSGIYNRHHRVQANWDTAYVGWAAESPTYMTRMNGETRVKGDDGFLPELNEYNEQHQEAKRRNQWNNVLLRGFRPREWWPASAAYDLIMRLTAFTLYFAAFWIMFGFTVADYERFQSRLQFSTSFLTNGVQPTPANGLMFTVGNLKFAWVVMFSFGVSCLIHGLFSGLMGILGELAGMSTQTLAFVFRGFPFWFHLHIIKNLEVLFDPSKFWVATFGQAVMSTLVLATIGVTDMVFAIAVYGMYVVFFWAYDRAHEMNFGYMARVLGYATPASISYGTTIDFNANGEAVERTGVTKPNASVTMERTWGQRGTAVATNRYFALFPHEVANTLTKVFCNFRSVVSFGPPMSEYNKEKYNNMVLSPTMDTDVLQNIDEKVARKVKSPTRGDRPNTALHNYFAMPELKEDFHDTVHHYGHMMPGNVMMVFLLVVMMTFYGGALHQDGSAFAGWQHAAFWLVFAWMFVTAFANWIRWYDIANRARTWPVRIIVAAADFVSMHHIFAALFNITVGYLIVVGSTSTIVNL